MRRPARPADVAILFRSRDSHREFEAALERRGVPTYVYKGLGFFDADEMQDGVAVLRYLADPTVQSARRGTVCGRGWSGCRIRRRAAGAAPRGGDRRRRMHRRAAAALGDEDREVLTRLRHDVPRWLAQVDRITPAELLSRCCARPRTPSRSRGPRRAAGAREPEEARRAWCGGSRTAATRRWRGSPIISSNSRSATNRTPRSTRMDAVSLMTVHAAKGLEFPIVFVVNLGRGTGGVRAPIRVATDPSGGGRRSRSPTISRKPTRTRRRASGKRPSGCSTWR